MPEHRMTRLSATSLLGLCVGNCSTSSIPASARVQDLGVLALKADVPRQIPLSGTASSYCVALKPEQLPQKVELFATLARLPDKTLRIWLELVPTPSDYDRLWLKRLSAQVRSGDRCEIRVGEHEWIRFTPTLEE